MHFSYEIFYKYKYFIRLVDTLGSTDLMYLPIKLYRKIQRFKNNKKLCYFDSSYFYYIHIFINNNSDVGKYYLIKTGYAKHCK